jgi:hypothetical protein
LISGVAWEADTRDQPPPSGQRPGVIKGATVMFLIVVIVVIVLAALMLRRRRR